MWSSVRFFNTNYPIKSFFHVEKKYERKNSLAAATAAATTATRGCSHIHDQIAETFSTKNCGEKLKDRRNLFFLRIIGWIHNICGGGGGGGGSHSFFHGDNEDRTRHMQRFARNGSREELGGSFFPGERATVSREITPAGKWHSAEHVIGRDVNSNRF